MSVNISEGPHHLNPLNIQQNHKYYAWKLFFPDEEYRDNSATVRNIESAKAYIKKQCTISLVLSLSHLEAGIPICIDIEDLCKDEMFINFWPDFKEDLESKPLYTLSCFKLAIHQTILDAVPKDTLKGLLDSINSFPTVRLQIINYRPIMCLQNLKVNCYGKLISTQGCVIRINRTKHLPQWIVFTCNKCKLERIVAQLKRAYTVPKKCGACGISKFSPILDSPYTRSIMYQMIRIQESINEEETKGATPRILDVELTDNLVDVCMPGDDITVTGVMKVQGLDNSTGKTNVTNAFSLYMEAVTIINNKSTNQDRDILNNEMSSKDYFAIKNMYNKPDVFELLVHSLCPNIYGHEMIKAGLLLSLIGGSAKHASLRDDIHALLVGDPGLGKSQMLQACARVAAKGIYICGNSSTSSGLTVTLTREGGSTEFALEPGALVLADKGCCCIDEFDKMTTQHQALLEAMEQQSVSVAKSGTICSLPARTSILAAANPIGGRYDKTKSIIDNLNISKPILSRFDLVFLLLDNPDEQIDASLCNHIMKFHTSSRNIKRTDEIANYNTSIKMSAKESSLKKRLVNSSHGNIELISQFMLRKYISYARQYVNPKLSTDAVEILQKYYLTLRSKNEGIGGIPVCNRQLQGMIRLTEARAKSELRTEATETDALEIVEILQYMMLVTAKDNSIPVSHQNDVGKLTNKKVQVFLKLLKRKVNETKQNIFSLTDLNELAEQGGILIEDFTRFISMLNEQGILLKNGRNVYKYMID